MITFDGKKSQQWITWRSPDIKGKVTVHYDKNNIPTRLTVSSDFKYLKDYRWMQSQSTSSYWELKNPSVSDIISVLAAVGDLNYH